MSEREEWLIGWKDRRTGETGQGASRFTKQVAETLCGEANAECPDIDHYPVPAPARPVIQEIEDDE